MALSDKYVVIKTEDWADLLLALHGEGQHEISEAAQNMPIPDEYFVVRRQDVFAPAGLFAYAANVRTAVEVNRYMGLSIMSDETRDRLLDFSDALVEMASEWQECHDERRVPARIPD